MRQVIIYSGEDGYFVVECPSLPGCISQGKTREDFFYLTRKDWEALMLLLAFIFASWREGRG